MEYIIYIILAAIVLIPIYLFSLNRKVKSAKEKLEWHESQVYTTLRIDVPKNNEKTPLSAEQMFASIHGIYSESSLYQNHLSFEIVAIDKYIQFYVHLPKHIKDFVEGQIYAQYPTVEISEVDDYASKVRPKDINFASCDLTLTKADVYPIKMFSSFEVDPLSGITSVLSKLNPGDEVWFQLLIRPTGDDWQEKGNRIVSAVRAGKSPGGQSFFDLFGKGLKNFLFAIVREAMHPGAETVAANGEVKLSAGVDEALKGIEQKIVKLGFETKIRIFAIAPDSLSAKVKCQSVAATFKQFNTTNLNGFKMGEITQNNFESWQNFVDRSFEEEGAILNITELASVYHLPHVSVETPNIVWSGAKKGEPPANLPLTENTPPEELTILGMTNFRNSFREFGIKLDDRRRHIYIVGKSGTGKSTLIENMAIDDVTSGKGVIIVDPHGDLADKVLSCIPADRENDVIVFDPADRAFPIAFNLLETVDDDFKGMVASGFVGIFKKIFGDSWGPRLEHILRNTVLALLDYPDSTMVDIPGMLTDNHFREKVVAKVKDPIIRDFWVNEFAQYDAKFRTEAVSPILNKIGQFLATATIRNIVGQSKSRINIREIMDQKKILLINLSRGKIGEDNSALLGAMMITKIQLAAMSRADVSVDNRPDCYLYVDEFQNFATDSFAVILSEARKYNLCLTMANQYVEQMPEAVRSAVFGNAGTMITFRVGGSDASFLVKEYEPVFDANDLVNLDRYTVYIKLLIDGIAPPAFSAKTLPPVQRLTGNSERIVALSRDKYSSIRSVVEEQINNRSKEEENELKADAEAFRKGGLEALLLKNKGASLAPGFSEYAPKPEPVRTLAPVSMPAPELDNDLMNQIKEKERERAATPDIQVQTAISPETINNHSENISTKPEDSKADKPQKPRVFKHQNVIGTKIYKEQTARGGAKWYIAEEIDLDKIKELGVEVTQEALDFMNLAKSAHKGGGVVEKHEHKIVEEKKEPETKKPEEPKQEKKEEKIVEKIKETDTKKEEKVGESDQKKIHIENHPLPVREENSHTEVKVEPKHEHDKSDDKPVDKSQELHSEKSNNTDKSTNKDSKDDNKQQDDSVETSANTTHLKEGEEVKFDD